MNAKDSPIQLTESEGVARVQLNAPPQNRVSLSMLQRLVEVFGELTGRADVRAVLVEAQGPDFCTGADLRDPELAALITRGEEGQNQLSALGERLIDGLAQLPVPTVVAARGRVIGAGACLFTAADFRFCSPQTELQFPEVDRGMHLGWHVLGRLYREFGPQRARRLALLGEKVGAQELAGAFATLSDHPEQAGWALAHHIAEKAPLAVRSITRVFRKRDEVDGPLTRDDAAAFSATVRSADFIEAMTAWAEKRAPRYRGE